MKIVYLHGFRSSGESSKVDQLRKHFKDCKVVSPTLSSNPLEAVKQIHEAITTDIDSTVVVGTSLGGFYASYVACVYDIPGFIINPSLEPHFSLKSKVGSHKRYGTAEDYDFKLEYLTEFEKLFTKLHESEKNKNNLHFYISKDDKELTFEKLDDLFPKKKILKVFDNSGHRFSKFTEIFPDIRAVLDSFKSK